MTSESQLSAREVPACVAKLSGQGEPIVSEISGKIRYHRGEKCVPEPWLNSNAVAYGSGGSTRMPKQLRQGEDLRRGGCGPTQCRPC